MSDDAKSSSSGTGLTFPQIAGSALAAATAAIMGSFLGVFGTIGGAAVASIVSTVGSALYQRSLEKTRDTVKDRLVVGGAAPQKVAGAVARVTGAPPSAGSRPGAQVPQNLTPNQQTPQAPQATQQAAPPVPRPGVVGPGRGPVGPGGRGPAPGPGQRPGMPPRTAVPGPPGRPVGPPGPGDRPVRGGGRTVNTQVFGQDPMTRVEGAPRIPNARVPGTPPGGVGPTARFQQGPGGPPDGPDAPTQLTASEPPQDRAQRRKLLGKKGWVAVAGLAASVFAIALLASFGVETAAGHPLSGGSSGTSVGSLFGQNTGTPRATTSDTPTSTTTSSSDGSSSNDQRTGSDRSGSDTPTTTRSSSQSGNGNNQQDQQGRSSQQNLLPTQLLPQLGGGSSSNG